MKNAKFLIFLSSPILFVLLEVFLFWPKFLLSVEVLALIWIFFVVRSLAHQSSLGKKWFIHALLPALLFASLSFSASILINPWVIQLIFIFLLVFLARYFQVLHGFFVENNLKEIDRLHNFSLSGGLLIIFFSTLSIFSLQVFLSWSNTTLFLLCLLSFALVTYHNWQVCNLNIRENFSLYVVVNILLLQTVAVLFFWPFAYQVLAVFMALIYYVLINCTRLYLGASLDNKKIQLYLIFTGAAFLLLLLTARWF